MAKIPPFDIGGRLGEFGLVDQIRRAFISLQSILSNLSPVDNFKSYVWSGTIPAATEQEVPHTLKRVPTGYLIIFNSGGILQAGDTKWTADNAYIKNVSSSSDAVGKILFFL